MDFEKFKELVRNTDDENEYTDYITCNECPYDVTCCEMCPCELHPSDLIHGITRETIMDLLSTELVDICITISGVFIIRMKEKENSGLFESHCIALSNNGCILPFNNRPFYGRKTFPCRPDDHTDEEKRFFSNEGITDAWKPYQDILEDCFDNTQ